MALSYRYSIKQVGVYIAVFGSQTVEKYESSETSLRRPVP